MERKRLRLGGPPRPNSPQNNLLHFASMGISKPLQSQSNFQQLQTKRPIHRQQKKSELHGAYVLPMDKTRPRHNWESLRNGY